MWFVGDLMTVNLRMNLRFRSVTRPDGNMRILYWRLGNVSTIRPLLSHRFRLFWLWTTTSVSIVRGGNSRARALYFWMRIWFLFGPTGSPDRSYNSTPVSQSVSLSVCLSLAFLRIGSLFFSDFLHEVRGTYVQKSDGARFLKKKSLVRRGTEGVVALRRPW